MNFDSKYLRAFSIVSDEYGEDPLLDRVLNKLDTIVAYTTHRVSQEERGSPDLIASNSYGEGRENLYWVILAFNGIYSYKDILEGTNLKIPDYQSVIALFTEHSVRDNEVQRVVTI